MKNERQAEFRLNLLGSGYLHVTIPIDVDDRLRNLPYTFKLLEQDDGEARETSLFIEAPVSELFQEVASRLEGMVLLAIRQAVREQRQRARKHAENLEALEVSTETRLERKKIESYREGALFAADALENLLSSMSSDAEDIVLS